MGDANTALTERDARHLLRRTGFGATPREVGRLAGRRSTSRGDAADKLLKFRPKRVRFKTDDGIDTARDQWIAYMVKTKAPLQEKLVLFLHDHFATNDQTVESTKFMVEQNALLRLYAKGNFKDLVRAMNTNIAMMIFLDTVRNRKESPNENYPREFLELFTCGVTDLFGQPNYRQEDIVQIARGFTGWDYDSERKGRRTRQTVVFHDHDHDFVADFPERGAKVLFEQYGGFGPAGRSFTTRGEGANEIDEIVDIVFAHRDSEGRNTIARRMAYRLLEYFAHPNPDLSVVDEVVATSSFDTNWELAPLLRAIFVHDAFYESGAAVPFVATTRKSVKWPIDFVVGTLRMLGMKVKVDRRRGLRVEGGGKRRLRDHLEDMGQEVFDPPSVFGWDWEGSWISSATLLARYGFARDVSIAEGRGRSRFRPDKLVGTKLTDPGAIVDATTDALGVTDQLVPEERTALIAYLTNDGANPVIDLKDEDVLRIKLHGLFALVMQSPAYQLH